MWYIIRRQVTRWFLRNGHLLGSLWFSREKCPQAWSNQESREERWLRKWISPPQAAGYQNPKERSKLRGIDPHRLNWGDIVLLYTGHYDKHYGKPGWTEVYSGFTKEAAQYLCVEKKVKNWGIDAPNSDTPGDMTYPVHMVTRRTKIPQWKISAIFSFWLACFSSLPVSLWRFAGDLARPSGQWPFSI